MQVTKRTFLKGLLATAAAGGVVSQASAKPQAGLPAKWDREADVVILGYGGAGASAAITAKDAGADVVIFEKTAQGGGNTAVSSGGMMIPNNRERAITYLAKTYDFANSQKDQELLEAFVDEAMKSKTSSFPWPRNRRFTFMVTPVSRTFLNPTLSINGVSALRKDRKLAAATCSSTTTATLLKPSVRFPLFTTHAACS